MRTSLPILLLVASPVLAQPAAIAPNYAPNFFNRTQQPLSPYLNLLRGLNPATNYYYGVRPGLPSGGQNIYGQTPPYQLPSGLQFGGFLPQAQQPYDASARPYEPGGQPIVLSSPAHPVMFGNSYPQHGSYFNVYAQNVNRSGYSSYPQPGATQSLQGLGTVGRPRTGTPAAAPRRPPTINAFP